MSGPATPLGPHNQYFYLFKDKQKYRKNSNLGGNPGSFWIYDDELVPLLVTSFRGNGIRDLHIDTDTKHDGITYGKYRINTDTKQSIQFPKMPLKNRYIVKYFLVDDHITALQ